MELQLSLLFFAFLPGPRSPSSTAGGAYSSLPPSPLHSRPPKKDVREATRCPRKSPCTAAPPPRSAHHHLHAAMPDNVAADVDERAIAVSRLPDHGTMALRPARVAANIRGGGLPVLLSGHLSRRLQRRPGCSITGKTRTAEGFPPVGSSETAVWWFRGERQRPARRYLQARPRTNEGAAAASPAPQTPPTFAGAYGGCSARPRTVRKSPLARPCRFAGGMST